MREKLNVKKKLKFILISLFQYNIEVKKQFI